MPIILKLLTLGDCELALTLIQHSLPFQLNESDPFGQTPLHIAIQKNYLDIAKSLLDKNVDINAFAKDPGYSKMTPLHYAALTGNQAAAKLLLAYQANPFLKNGQSLLAASLAEQHGFYEVARLIDDYAKNVKLTFNKNKNSMTDHDYMRKSLARRILELQNSSIEALKARVWLCQHAKPNANVVSLLEYKIKKNKK